MKIKAVFLDRDGTINQLFDNRPPWNLSEIKFCPDVFRPLKRLQDNGYNLFIVTNQPDYAKGKTTYSSLLSVQQIILDTLKFAGIIITDYYCCYHQQSDNCICRKPKPYFLLEADKQHNIDFDNSWFIGDRESDIQCGQSVGVKTILLNEPKTLLPDYVAGNLKEAVNIILKEST